MNDFVTVVTHPTLMMVKTWTLGADGAPVCRDYDNGEYFSFEKRMVGGLDDLKAVIDSLSAHQTIVLGKYVGDNPGRDVRRSVKEPVTLADCSHWWLPLDLEKFEPTDAEGQFDPVQEPYRAVNLALSRLPDGLNGADVIYQHTAGAGIKPGIRLRLFAWLDRPLTIAEMKAWLTPYATSAGGIIDPSIYSPERPIYAGPVQFQGVTDPVTTDRTGMVRAWGACVNPPEVIEVKPPAAAREAPEGVTFDLPVTVAWAVDTIRNAIQYGGLPTEGDASDNRTFNLAAKLRDGDEPGRSLHPETVGYLLRTYWAPHFDPDWLAAKVDSAYGNAQNKKPGAGPSQKTDAETFGPAAARAAAQQGVAEKSNDRRAKILAGWRSARDILRQPDPVAVVKGLIHEGENIGIIGPPKAGKSFVALDIAWSIAANQPTVGGHEVARPGPIIYMSGEGNAGMKKRLRAWAGARGISEEELDTFPIEHIVMVPSAAGGAPEGEFWAGIILEKLGGPQPSAAFIDTQARSLGTMRENDAETANSYLDMTEALVKSLGCPVVTLIHASNRDNGGKAIHIRGSSGFDAGYDLLMTVEKNDMNGTMKLSYHMGKDHGEEDIPPVYYRLCHYGPGLVGIEKSNANEFGTEKDAAKKETEEFRDEVIATLQAHGIDSLAKSLRDAALAELIIKRRWSKSPENLTEREAYEAQREVLRKQLTSTRSAKGAKWPEHYVSKRIEGGAQHPVWFIGGGAHYEMQMAARGEREPVNQAMPFEPITRH